MSAQNKPLPTYEPVVLNIYDVHWSSRFSSWMGLGMYHSGVCVFGAEYSYAGHGYSYSGIYRTKPRAHEELAENMRFRSTITLGTTTLTPAEVSNVVRTIGRKWVGKEYNLLRNNCNDFSDEFSMILCDVGIPKWVNRLARYAGPIIEPFVPKHWFMFQEETTIPLPKKPKVEIGMDARKLDAVLRAKAVVQVKKSNTVASDTQQTSGDSSLDDSEIRDGKATEYPLLTTFRNTETRKLRGHGVKRIERKRAESEPTFRRNTGNHLIIRTGSVGCPRLERSAIDSSGSCANPAAPSPVSVSLNPESKSRGQAPGQLGKSKSKAQLRKSRRRQQHPKPRPVSKSKPRKLLEHGVPGFEKGTEMSFSQDSEIPGDGHDEHWQIDVETVVFVTSTLTID